ncbi:MAG: cell division protein FtsZ [Gammaproteobacteria bacterium 28-57-27]|nr:MAG: cell division protein FtsZ [Gammaproteobacteria bacterium 28-57-27]
MFELVDSYSDSATIKVVGVGGGGGNAVAHMLQHAIEGVDFICANTDVQALKKSQATVQLQIGANITKGLGAGANPELGRQAALEDRDRIQEVLAGTDMLFITTGMGGGTGTGAAPVIAQIAKDMGILTVAVVTRPFGFEGKKRMEQALNGIRELEKQVDSLIVIPNEKLLAVMGKSAQMMEAFNAANGVLLSAVQGISELITRPGFINVDFADVRTVMEGMGSAMMGTGIASGEGRAREAAEAAIHSPLLDEVVLRGARGILVNVTAGMDLTIGEYDEIGEIIHELASEDANVKIGMAIDPEMNGEIRVTVVATGLNMHKVEAAPMARPRVVVDNDSRNQARQQAEAVVAPAAMMQGNAAFSYDLVDIPAFLRRQAD